MCECRISFRATIPIYDSVSILNPYLFLNRTFILFVLVLFRTSLWAVNNPVIQDGYVNDCDVMKYNGEYYISGNWIAGDMLYSRDLQHWGHRTHIFSWTNSWYVNEYPGTPDLAIHDNHLRYDNGTFHLYCQLGADITHAVSSNVWGPYNELSLSSPFSGKIGAEVFLDDDGKFYFYPTRFNNGNQTYVRPMQDLWNFKSGSSYTLQLSPSGGWEGSTSILEGAKVFKYRNRYYMLYNAYHTEDPQYSFGCAEASGPTSFSNSGKYPYSVLTRRTYSGTGEINTIGQPWLVEGLNGFEKWVGYFAIHHGMYSDGLRRQSIDRAHFFDRTLYIDGPTSPYATGYHPGPAHPQYRGLFNRPDGPLPSEDWTAVNSGNWFIISNQASQNNQTAFAFNTINRNSAAHYLIEGNLRFSAAADGQDKAGLIAYYKDDNNWMIVGLDRIANSWYYHKRENGSNTVVGTPYALGEMDYAAYHKIRVTKNGSYFDVTIDDKRPPGYGGLINTSFSGKGIPGIYTDHSEARFDGIIYTVGWDEFDNTITGWGNSLSSKSSSGTWTVGSSGLTQSNALGESIIFKGDGMPFYEFSAQVYKEGSFWNSIGILPVYIDETNYVRAAVYPDLGLLVVTGRNNGMAFSQQAPVPYSQNYNLRSIKLSDRIIMFINGSEAITVNQKYGPSQVALMTNKTPARFNGIMLYRIEPCDEASLVAHFPLDNDIYDMTGNDTEVAAYGNSMTYGEGRRDSAAVFDGTNYFKIPRIVQYDFSITLWVKTTQIGPTAYNGWGDGVGIIDGDSAGYASDFGIELLENHAALGIYGGALISNVSINDGQWHSIVATRKMADGQFKLYVDGALEAAGYSIRTPLNSADTLTVGRSQIGLKNFQGSIDDIRIYDRVLSDIEIQNDPACRVQLYSDLNRDCIVNLKDMAILSKCWLECGLWPAGTCLE